MAIGKRPFGVSPSFVAKGRGSKSSVFVPTHRHAPCGLGSSFTGMLPAASDLTVSSSTIGCEKVMLRWDAMGTSPSGANRSTSSVFAAGSSGFWRSFGGGKTSSRVFPVRAGGNEPLRSAKGLRTPGVVDAAGSLPRRRVTSSGWSAVEGASGVRRGCSACASP